MKNYSNYRNEWQQAIKRSSLSGPEKHVALVLLTYVNHNTGDCFPSQQLMADDWGMKRNYYSRHLKALEAQGWLEVIKKYKGKKPYNTYLLRTPEVHTKSDESLLRTPGVHSKPKNEPVCTPKELTTHSWGAQTLLKNITTTTITNIHKDNTKAVLEIDSRCSSCNKHTHESTPPAYRCSCN